MTPEGETTDGGEGGNRRDGTPGSETDYDRKGSELDRHTRGWKVLDGVTLVG